ncbi:MAG: TrkH family potassium uptake protein [Selenomonadaceae bacterium]|nr:TrkH family potassium uptake protein [Selenomonadaceae bacterium]
MDKKIIASLIGSVLLAFTLTYSLPILYAIFVEQYFYAVAIFSAPAILTAAISMALYSYGRGHRRRLPVTESALSMLLIYPVIAVLGMVPFLVTGYLSPIDAFLETVSDVTSAGLGLMPNDAPYVLRIWQSTLMWFGSLIFLAILVTLMPEVGGSFGLSMTLQGGQLFSPLFGQMNAMVKRMIKTYTGLTLVSFTLFKLAGLNFFDALLMAMRCISTGGGKFFPGVGNAYVEYAAAVSMLLACGNFLLYYRLIQTLPPPRRNEKIKFFQRVKNYVKRFRQNLFDNVKIFFKNSEVKTCTLIILFSVIFILFAVLLRGHTVDVELALRYALFHTVSFLSTTGLTLEISNVHDFDKFVVFLMAVFGGCMGSVTGGLKMMRVLVLFKSAAAEVTRTMHPHMLTSVRVNDNAVPRETVGRITAFFFLSCFTLFLCAAVLSFMEPKFSEAVAMAAVCLTNVGCLPELIDANNFLHLSDVGKIFCAVILVVGRVEIFALLIFIAGFNSKQRLVRS